MVDAPQPAPSAAPDPQSPTSLILGYLSSKGLPPTSANVRSALELNSANPGVIGGLVNQAPPAPDSVASVAPSPAAPSAPPQQAQADMPVPPIPPAGGPQAGPAAVGGDNGGLISSLITAILGGGGATLAANLRPRIGAPNAAPGAAPLEGEVIPPSPQAQASGPVQRSGPSIEGDPLEQALAKAIGGPQPQIPSGNVPQPNPQQSMIDKAMGLPAPSLQLPAPPQALSAPGAKPPIALPDATSGPTIVPPNPAVGQSAEVGLPATGDMWKSFMGDKISQMPSQAIRGTTGPKRAATDPVLELLRAARGLRP